jgi:hypothetical protein
MPYDIFNIGLDWSKHPTQTLEPYRTPIQYPGSGIYLRNITDDVQIKVSVSFTNMSKSDENALLTYFNNHKGRLNAFWFPIPKNYFTALYYNISAADTHINIADSSPIWLRGYERMFILTKSGSLYHAKIDNITTLVMNLTTAIGGDILLTDISIFGKMIYCRFDQDDLVIKHTTTAISECDAALIELPKEYPAT